MSDDVDDRQPELPQPRSIEECDRMLSDASIILAVQQTSRGSIVGLYRIRRTIDAILDARLKFSGPPVCMSVPYGGTEPCGRVKSRFGSSIYLCSECDMRRCEASNCDRRVLSLNNLYCNPCRGVAYSPPWPPKWPAFEPSGEDDD